MNEQTQEYMNTLENGLQAICKAMGVSSERYDTDQADTECYMDCFREAAELIKKAGFVWDADECEFITKQSSRSPACYEPVWTKVGTELPDDPGWYLVALDENGTDLGYLTDQAWPAYFNETSGIWDCCDPVDDGLAVTHWMPMPALPTAGT